MKQEKIHPPLKTPETTNLELQRIERRLKEIRERRVALAREKQDIEMLMLTQTQARVEQNRKTVRNKREEKQETTARIDTLVTKAAEAIEDEKDKKIIDILETEAESENKTAKQDGWGKKLLTLLQKIHQAGTKTLKRKLLYYTVLPLGITAGIALQTETGDDYFEMAKNWSERHIIKRYAADPNIEGVDGSYAKSPTTATMAEKIQGKTEVSPVLAKRIERTTYDFLGKSKID